jgi:hypothetical protein
MGYKFFRLENLMYNYPTNTVNFTDTTFVQTFYKNATWQFKDDSDTKYLLTQPF